MMTNRDDDDLIDIGGFKVNPASGDDSPPLMNKVPDPPPGWGKLTTDRNKSAAYLAFVASHKKSREEQEKKKRG